MQEIGQNQRRRVGCIALCIERESTAVNGRAVGVFIVVIICLAAVTSISVVRFYRYTQQY